TGSGRLNPGRRAIAEYGRMSLEDAREEARSWHRLLHSGIAPRIEIERQRLSEGRRQENSFASVAEAYFTHIKRQGQRRAAETEREMRREFVARWGARRITDITRHDLLQIIEAALERGAPWQAHHLFRYAKRLFNWAIERGVYGLEHAPTHGMRPARIIGEKKPRTRVLSDAELKVLWITSEQLGYPYGPLVRLLMLTGQRKSEVAEAQWSEFDRAKRQWSIPPERMKTDAAHLVPLTDDAVQVLEGLPRFRSGDHLFST